MTFDLWILLCLAVGGMLHSWWGRTHEVERRRFERVRGKYGNAL